ncbi:hypothetical protein [Methyloversatilis sp. RAC08]|uniref:hypothetical protein n=1 Tax=Methyloversatilis sp. RAC08 TaxID=1842540 RepID=UPI00083DBF89|nr:hypothetical protein [Methyloversatilis sp. RAC08]
MIALGLASAGTAHAASASATLEWFSFDTRVIALADVVPVFMPGSDFWSGAHVNLFNGAQQFALDSDDWTSDLSASLTGATATIAGAEVPAKAGSFDVNPQELLWAGVDGTTAAGAETQRTIDFMLGAQTLVLFSVDYRLAVDTTGLNPMTSFVNTYASLFGFANGESFQALVQAGSSIPADNGVRQGRLVLAVANASDDEKSFVLSATSAAYIYAPVPEADSSVMFIAGLLLLGGMLVRRRQTALA